MAVKLSFDERNWLLKCYWKVDNVRVQRLWRVEFGTPPPARVTITRIRDEFEVDGTVQAVLKGRCGRRREVPLIRKRLMQSCRFLHDPERSHWSNVLARLLSRNSVFIEFCELRNGSLTFRDMSTFDVVVGTVLWQKVDILNMYRLKEV